MCAQYSRRGLIASLSYVRLASTPLGPGIDCLCMRGVYHELNYPQRAHTF